MKTKIIKNQAQCLICGEIIESTHRHDYVTCKCGNLSVDGGKDYCRRSFKEMDTWIDISIWEEDLPKSSYAVTIEEVNGNGETL